MTLDNSQDLCLDKPLPEIWEAVLLLLAKSMGQPSFESWIRPTRLRDLSSDEAVVAVVNDFNRNWICAKYLPDIETALSQIIGREVKVKVTVDTCLQLDYTPSIASISVFSEKSGQGQQNALPPTSNAIAGGSTNLNPKYRFDSYIVGSGNRFCHAASVAVADKPGHSYNPLFIYGGVGLGKTHLLQAIGNQILSHSPQMQVRYMSCEKFTNEVITSLSESRMADFRKRYRKIDVLLMDDIQFIEGKEATQEEFFHTFNALRDSGKQIVLSSDRPPNAFARLTERLRSRFEWGLIADIQSPDYETRLAILRRKAEVERFQVEDTVLEYIADKFTNNIRELEGALLRVHALSSLTGTATDLASVKEVLHPGGQQKAKVVLTIDAIIDAVGSHFRIEPSDIRSVKRSHDLTEARHIAMYLAHELLAMSFPRIGQEFANRKHTSVLYAFNKIKDELTEKPTLVESLRSIKRQLGL